LLPTSPEANVRLIGALLYEFQGVNALKNRNYSYPKRVRVTLIALAAAMTHPAIAAPAPADQAAGPVVVTLGTAGGPILRADRAQPANLLIVGNRIYLIDVGEGTTTQLAKAGIPVGKLDAVFLSHLHADHVAGMSSMLFTLWLDHPARPLEIYGPPGTAQLVAAATETIDLPARLFLQELPKGYPAPRDLFRVHEIDISVPSPVFKDDTVAVAATENSHYELFQKPGDPVTSRSYSYRFHTNHADVVFSGDTGPSPALETLARDADLLVSEVVDLDGITRQLRARSGNIDLTPMIAHMRSEHLAPEEIGRLATRAKVNAVLLTHFAGDNPGHAEEISAKVRTQFVGPVDTAVDLGRYAVKATSAVAARRAP
jgi:ribonuclease BN (tRNA processing enzyme)